MREQTRKVNCHTASAIKSWQFIHLGSNTYISIKPKRIEYCNVDLDLDKWIMNNYNLEDKNSSPTLKQEIICMRVHGPNPAHSLFLKIQNTTTPTNLCIVYGWFWLQWESRAFVTKTIDLQTQNCLLSAFLTGKFVGPCPLYQWDKQQSTDHEPTE